MCMVFISLFFENTFHVAILIKNIHLFFHCPVQVQVEAVADSNSVWYRWNELQHTAKYHTWRRGAHHRIRAHWLLRCPRENNGCQFMLCGIKKNKPYQPSGPTLYCLCNVQVFYYSLLALPFLLFSSEKMSWFFMPWEVQFNRS